nr:low temperature requirement protein A [Angustibacter aerolatus]
MIAFAAAAEEPGPAPERGRAGPAVGAYLFAVFAITWAWTSLHLVRVGVRQRRRAVPRRHDRADGRRRGADLRPAGGLRGCRRGREPEQPAARRRVPGDAGAAARPVAAGGPRRPRPTPDVGRVRRRHRGRPACAGWPRRCCTCRSRSRSPPSCCSPPPSLTAPVLVESRFGRPPWNAGHVAERFNLLTLITLGEVVAATTRAVGALVGEQGWSPSAVLLAASGLVLAAALWWAYFLIPSRAVLERWPDRTMAWRTAHLPLFGAIAAVGAGLRVAATAVEEERLSLLQIALALAVPVAVVLVTVFVTWSVLMRSHDLTHVPLFVLSVLPVAAAVVVGAAHGRDDLVEAAGAPGFGALVTVVALVTLGAVIEVVGHEAVGLRHTLRAVRHREWEPAGSG